MNIYKLTQDVQHGYDTFDSCIVCAENENEARIINPDSSIYYKNNSWMTKYSEHHYHENLRGKEYETEKVCPCWVFSKDVDKIKIEFIGKADDSIKKGCILSSFNAG